eukprot:scaffold24676_cov61-Phaeocystis_antarctica.AAC.1
MPLVSWHEAWTVWQAASLAASGSPKLGSAQSAPETRSSRLPGPGPHERRAATCDSRGRSSVSPRVIGLAKELRWPGLSRCGSGSGRTAREQQRAARRGTAIPIVAVVQAVVAARVAAKMAEVSAAASVGAARGRAA